MKKTVLALSTLVLGLAALGSAQAATAPHPVARPHHAAAPRLHDHVVEARAAQQRQWIAAGLHRHRLDAAQAASLRDAVATIERKQRSIDAQGREGVEQALAMSHRQAVLDWAIRAGRVDYEPQQIAALDTMA